MNCFILSVQCCTSRIRTAISPNLGVSITEDRKQEHSQGSAHQGTENFSKMHSHIQKGRPFHSAHEKPSVVQSTNKASCQMHRL
jgi:hypothetical protein